MTIPWDPIGDYRAAWDKDRDSWCVYFGSHFVRALGENGQKQAEQAAEEWNRKLYNWIWDVLVRYAGANRDPLHRESFVSAFMNREHPTTEFRFIGILGFGGKFRRVSSSFQGLYIDCYPEDLDPHRSGVIQTVNAIIQAHLPGFKRKPKIRVMRCDFTTFKSGDRLEVIESPNTAAWLVLQVQRLGESWTELPGGTQVLKSHTWTPGRARKAQI
jgi:hypothetical protein